METTSSATSTTTKTAAKPAKQQPVLKVLKAIYGCEGQTKDISSQIEALGAVKGHGRKVSNKLAEGDPVPGKKKTLDLTFTIDGVEHSKTYEEGQLLDFKSLIPAPVAEAAPATEAAPAAEATTEAAPAAEATTEAAPAAEDATESNA